MKHLKDYVLEANETNDNTTTSTTSTTSTTTVAPEAPESKMFTLDFSELEGADEMLKELEGKDDVEITDKKVIITLDQSKKFDSDCLKKLYDYSDTLRKSSKNATYEAYAQKTKRFANVIKDMKLYLEEVDKAKNTDK